MTSNSPLVSVIIPTYNRAHYICEAIESVLAQTCKNLEIIVVDDGSTDNTKDILSPFMDRIKYIYQENKRAPAVRNLGIRSATGQYLAFLDSDDLWLPEKTETQLSFLEKNCNYGFVFSNFIYFGDVESQDKAQHESICPSGYIFPQLFLRNCIGCLTMFMRKECIDKSGLFDEQIQTCEDYDLWLRIAKGFNGAYIDRVLAKYRHHASNISARNNYLDNQNATVHVLTKVLHLYPSAIDEIGRNAVNQRFFHLLWNLGYAYFDCYELATARSYFKRAIVHSPRSWSSYAYYLATCLPTSVFKGLRRMKRRASRLIRGSIQERQEV